jgi:hypothetical protein
MYMPSIIADPIGQIETFAFANTVKGVADINVTGIGFKPTCTSSTVPFNIPRDGQEVDPYTDNTILSIDLV